MEQEADSPAKVVNLMEALRKSLDQVSASKKKPVKAPVKRAARSARKRASASTAAGAEAVGAAAAPVRKRKRA